MLLTERSAFIVLGLSCTGSLRSVTKVVGKKHIHLRFEGNHRLTQRRAGKTCSNLGFHNAKIRDVSLRDLLMKTRGEVLARDIECASRPLVAVFKSRK